MAYSRANPSPRYLDLVRAYECLHSEGDKINDIAAIDTFEGKSLVPHMQMIGAAVANLKLRTLLDYGCGKAMAYEKAERTLPDGRKLRGLKNIWGVDSIAFYDPGYAPYQKIPKGKFDGVVCTDVLEHCPEEDIDWIVGELFGYANKFVFCTVACYPAKKKLPSGENAHITIKKPGWWIDKIEAIAAGHPAVRYMTWLDILPNKQRCMTVQG
jgi:hypothetical protein